MTREPEGGSLHLHWASRLMRGLWQEGVRRAILSPGSRSTPLTLAAALHPGIEHRLVLDERSAAFQALGEAKATGWPTLLVCTSGSALANYLPAITEAAQSGTPLLLLTADRPPHLRNSGSNQTLDQLHFFGAWTTFFHETGEPRGDRESLNRLDLLAKQAVHHALEPGGVVHLNLPFRKPLEPEIEQILLEQERAREQVESTSLSARPEPLRFIDRPADPVPNALMERLLQARRPLVIAGPDHPFRQVGAWIKQLQEATGIPVVAEPGAPLPDGTRLLTRFDPILFHPEEDDPGPDWVLRIGHTPYSASIHCLERWCDHHSECEVWHLHTRNNWQQGDARVDHRLLLHRPLRFTESQLASLNHGEHNLDTDWMETYHRLERGAEGRLQQTLMLTEPLTDPAVVRMVCENLMDEELLMVSNSMTVRDLALVRPASISLERIHANRGVSGIDGILSTAIGLTRASGQPVSLLIGDLASLHDSGALLSLADSSLPLRIIVLENGGGTIFRMLPVHRSLQREQFRDLFETPQSTRVSRLARAHGIPVRTAKDPSTLAGLLSDRPGGPELIECMTDPDISMDTRNTLWSPYS